MNVALVYDTRQPDTTAVYFVRAFKELGFNVTAIQEDEVNSVEDIYDIYFVVDSGKTYEIPQWKNGLTFYYAIDTHLQYDTRRDMAKGVKIPVFAQYTCGARKAQIDGLNSFWMPLGCDPWVHADNQTARIYDIAFVGHIYEDDSWRTTIEQKLRDKGYNSIWIGECPKETMSTIYSQSKIVLNHTVRDNKQDVNMRVFEAMSCGAYLLTQKLDNDDMSKLFEDGLYSEYVEDEDMFKKIEEILNNQQEYQNKANRAKLFVRANHTYTIHLRTLITKLMSL